MQKQSSIPIVDTILNLASVVPIWAWQIIGAFFITMTAMQVIKRFEPYSWPPYRRRKINLFLSILIGGGSITYLYDQQAKDFVVIAFMLGNNFLYSGLSKLVEFKSKDKNGIWTILHGFFRPYRRRK